MGPQQVLAYLRLLFRIDPAANQSDESWWTRHWEDTCKRKYSKLRFATHQKQQRVFVTIAKQLTNNRPPSTYVVLWGAGNFGPTSRGHASAPNKLMRRELAHHGVKIRMVNEDYTSQYTACCHVRSQNSKQRQQPFRRAQGRRPSKQ